MSLISVTGFPYALHETIVGFRSPGQSKTCLEKGSKLAVQNDSACDLVFVKLDGGFFRDGNSCDYSVSQQLESPRGMLVELKGADAYHAVEQLSCTLGRLSSSGVTVVYTTATVASRRGNNIPSAEWSKRVKKFKVRGVDLIRRGSNPNVFASEVFGREG